MEGFMQFLLIIAIIGFSIFKQINKAKKENPEDKIPVPFPPGTSPAPDQPATASRKQKNKKQPTPPIKEGVRTTYSALPAADATHEETKEPAAESDYAIHSAEEARRAIVWSEILQRKYS